MQRHLGLRWPRGEVFGAVADATLAGASARADRHPSSRLFQRLLTIWTHGGELVALVAVVLAAYSVGASAIFLPAPRTPPHAIPIIVALNIGAAMLIPLLRQRIHLDARAMRGLPDPLYTLYLATVILVSAQAAVTLAILTPFAAEAPYAAWSLLRRDRRRPSARVALRASMRLLRQAAAGATITLLAALVYVSVTALIHSLGQSRLHARIPAALLAAALTLLCICALRLGRQMYDAHQKSMAFAGVALWNDRARLWALCRVYLESPMFRFQALLLCACPLLPLVEAIDDVEAELAWALFLAPLCAVYYLALLSVRLQQRTDELQLTVEELGVSRRREAELQDYAALITQAQEDERRRLARDLHDDTAQALIALARGLDSLNNTGAHAATTSASAALAAPTAGHAASKHISALTHEGNAANDARFIAELGTMARQALENVRRACRDLRPSVLDDLGLASALDALSADMNRRGLPCVFQSTGVERPYPSTVEVAIYRIAQEALSNALHHAHPTQVRLELTYEPDAIRLVVADNGRGFDYAAQLRKARLARDGGDAPDSLGDSPALKPAKAPPSGAETRVGLGLLGMRERAALIGATLDIQSVRGLGARLTLVARANP